jgi:hypothetical protein
VLGAPVAYAERDMAGIAMLFDALAAEVASRLSLREQNTEARPTSFLM